MENKIPLLVIAGPTASGKTACAVELAKIYDGEIVSADSMHRICGNYLTVIYLCRYIRV